MQIEHGARLDVAATIRCPRCGHRITLFAGARVPRCYCGGEQFELQPARADRPARDAPGQTPPP